MSRPADLYTAIDMFSANDVATMLRTSGIRDIPKTKEGKSRLWRQQMVDPARIRVVLARLLPRPRQALQVLQAVEGAELRTARYRSLLRRGGIVKESVQTNVWPPARPENAADPTSFEEVLAHLLLHGLVWSHTLPQGAQSSARIGFNGGLYVYIPDEVLAQLPPLPVKERVRPTVAHVLSASARTCQRDLYLLWSAAREEPFGLVATGLLRMGDLRRAAKQLLIPETIATGTKESDYRRFFFLRRLLTAVGAIAPGVATGLLTGQPGPAFLSASPAERVKASFQSWRDGNWWNELWATYTPGLTRASGTVSTDAPVQVSRARRKVLETLVALIRKLEEKQEPAETWVTVDELADILHDRDEEFLIDRQTADTQARAYGYSQYYTYSPYLYNQLMWQWENYGKNEEEGWDGVERTFIQAVLSEGLYWLGLVDLGYTEPVAPEGGAVPAGLRAVRLTDMGRWLLLGADEPAIPEETGRVVLQPNFRIFAFDPISDSVLARLDSFATRLNAERAIEYELGRESVYRAQLAGQSAPEIAAWLEQTTGTPLPQNVARTLAEWHAAFERIVVRRRVGWIEAATPALVDAILADPRLQTAIVKRATPTGLIVRDGKMDLVEQALLAAGELPARSARADAVQPGSVIVAEDGTVLPAQPAPSLYVHGALQPFVEPAGGGWRITPASVARAAAGGTDAAAILAQLASMAAGPLPAGLSARIKAWSKHYGSASIAAVTLVQFRDQDTLDELLRDPELARVLKPFHAAARLGLASVAPEKIELARQLLIARGVDVIVQ